jgi:hypothetical protein
LVQGSHHGTSLCVRCSRRAEWSRISMLHSAPWTWMMIVSQSYAEKARSACLPSLSRNESSGRITAHTEVIRKCPSYGGRKPKRSLTRYQIRYQGMCTPNLGEAHRRGGTELRGRLVSLLCFHRFFLQLGECCSAFADVFYYPIESFSPEFASFPAQTSVRQDDSEPLSSCGKLFELRPEKLDSSRRLIHLLSLEASLVSAAARVGSG